MLHHTRFYSRGIVMKIRLRSFGTLRRDFGKEAQLEIGEGSSLRDLISSLPKHERLLDGQKVKDDVYLLLNGRNVDRLDLALKDGDEISLVPAIIGG